MVDESYANRISDRIIDLVNEERRKPDFQPVSLLAGLLLGLMGYLRTANRLSSTPLEMRLLGVAVSNCLSSMFGKEGNKDADA